MKHLIGRSSLTLALFLLIATGGIAQNLTVREIMAEPSIAGMRVEGEKLSPDGAKVVYLWNAEGKMPRDLYLVSTSGGEPTKILSPSDLPPPSRPPEKENKLDYGLMLRDDFVKARENQLGGFEWSPDSKRLVFSYGGDLYILDLTESKNVAKWRAYKSAIERKADLMPVLVDGVKSIGVQESEWFATVAESRARLLNALNVNSGSGGTESTEQINEVLLANESLENALNTFGPLLEKNYPQLRSNERLLDIIIELASVENRIKVGRSDFAGSPKARRLTRTQTPETGARFLDNNRILFSQSGNLFVLDLSNSLLTQVSREGNAQNFISVLNPTPNKPGMLIAYVVSDSSKNKALLVPNYLDEFVVTNPARRGWTDQKVVVAPADGGRDTPFEIKLPKPEGVSNIRRMVWAADNSSLIIDRVDKDTKRRILFYVYDVGSKGEKIIPIIEETDDKWQASLSSIFEPNPKDPSELFFGSEKDGFNHLYLAKLEKATTEPNPTGVIRQENPSEPGYSGMVTTTQLTNGNWQVEWAKWLSQGVRILYLSTEAGAAGREFYMADPRGGKHLGGSSNQRGMKSSPQLSETNDNVLYESSQWNKPGELFVQVSDVKGADVVSPIPARKITSTVSEAFLKMTWSVPKFIEIPSRDNKKIPAKIYLPSNFNAKSKSKSKYPMVVFVHGAGYLQNVINGWNNYFREFMFNELLTQKGYVVLDIDYRGSAGYGRAWRTDVYDFLGGKDYDDHIDSIDYMVKLYNVNPGKVGVYGGSYGGFMAGMLATRAPDKIAAAAALRPVFDWKNYYASSPGYTAQRLGFPDKNPEAYKRSSPITYADKLERPLLILHGMSDDNVHVQDSIQMMEKLIRLGKTQYFETMLYPSENHGFVRPESWTDEYERILAFFEKHLK